MTINGEAIYGTHPIRPYASTNVYLTQSKDSLNTYAFYLGDVLPAEITIDRFTPPAKSKLTILGTKTTLKWREEDKKMIITIPPALQNKPTDYHAVAIKISA